MRINFTIWYEKLLLIRLKFWNGWSQLASSHWTSSEEEKIQQYSQNLFEHCMNITWQPQTPQNADYWFGIPLLTIERKCNTMLAKICITFFWEKEWNLYCQIYTIYIWCKTPNNDDFHRCSTSSQQMNRFFLKIL